MKIGSAQPCFQQGRGTTRRLAVLKKLFSQEVLADRYGVAPQSRSMYWYYPVRLKDLLLRYTPEFFRFVRRGRQATIQAANNARLAEWLAPITTPHREGLEKPRR